jgi:predicted phosphodiesterase
MSFAKRVKSSVKEAIKFISDFEDTAIQLAGEQQYDYVVCGHIHRAQMRSQDAHGRKVTYLNSGDWVESLTALEYKWDRWSIYEYDEMDYDVVNPKLRVKSTEKTAEEEEEEYSDSVSNISTEEIFQQITRQHPAAH